MVQRASSHAMSSRVLLLSPTLTIWTGTGDLSIIANVHSTTHPASYCLHLNLSANPHSHSRHHHLYYHPTSSAVSPPASQLYRQGSPRSAGARCTILDIRQTLAETLQHRALRGAWGVSEVEATSAHRRAPPRSSLPVAAPESLPSISAGIRPTIDSEKDGKPKGPTRLAAGGADAFGGSAEDPTWITISVQPVLVAKRRVRVSGCGSGVGRMFPKEGWREKVENRRVLRDPGPAQGTRTFFALGFAIQADSCVERQIMRHAFASKSSRSTTNLPQLSHPVVQRYGRNRVRSTCERMRIGYTMVQWRR